MEPVICPRDAEAEELAEYHLQRVGLQVDQKEQQLVRVTDEGTMPPTSGPALTRLTSGRSIHGIGTLAGRLECRQEIYELSGCQTRHRQKQMRLGR